MAHFVPLTTYACAGPCSAWSSLMSLRRPSLQKERPPPSVLNDRWRESGDWIGFYQQRRGQTRSCQIPSGRAAGSVANHPAGPGSSYRLVSDAIVRSLPESSPLIGWIASCLRLESNQHPRCFRPLLYHLSYRGVCRLVAGTSQLVSRFDGIYIIFSLVDMGCDFHGFRYLDDGFYMRSTWPF